ncbi:hypothetical protein SBV1_1350004 [Verrucomicrobia bacterium]|nr:hypothetical protein SBV1_1350004 [Verrucomicrobiota bacterium]
MSLFDLASGSLYYEDFAQANSGPPPTPWNIQSGAWAVRGGVLQGGTDPLSTYSFVYLTNTWSDYSVQAQFQFGVGAYGGGLGARLNPTNGAHYAAWIYPSGNNMHLLKFQNWSNATILASVNLPVIGTNAHTLMLAMEGSQIAVYYDSQMVASVADTNSPYLSGGVSLDMFTFTIAYQVSVGELAVAPLVPPDNYLMAENTTLTVGPAGVLGNVTGVYSTNLNALLVSGPANGALDLSSNGAFSYTPAANFTGTDSFSYQANDSQTNLGVAIVTLTVNAPHSPPGLPPQTNFTINVMTSLVVTNTAIQTVTPPLALGYSLIDAPAGAAVDTNGIITWTPGQEQAPSTNVITTVVSDNGLPSQGASNSFVVVVLDQNSAPVLPSQPNFVLDCLATLAVTNTATEADIHSVSLTYMLVTAPPSATIDANGIITWTPVLAQLSSTNVFTTVVTDDDPLAANTQQLSATNTFTVVVNAVHNGPSLALQMDQSISLPATLLVTNTAIETDCPPTILTYTLVNPPIGAQIDNNGIITWTPVQAQAPSTNRITTIVSDNGSPALSATNGFTVTVSGLPLGALYYQNFAQAASGSLAPWVVQAGAWAIANGMLQGGLDPLMAYGFVYLTNAWSDYSLQGQLQFAAGAYGGGLGGRLNPATGAHYAAWVYPGANTLHLIKFSNWTTPTFLTTKNLPNVGTNAHVLKLAFRGGQIAVYYDGALATTYTDNVPYLTGGISAEMYTGNSAYVMSLASVLVNPLAVPADYLMNGGTTLTVGAPGLLGGDTGVYGTNLSAVLVSGASEGSLSVSNNGGFTYTPAAGFLGQDSFVYQANDNQTNLGTALVTITVVPAPRSGPSLPAQSSTSVDELSELVVTNTASDSDLPLPTLSYALVDPPAGAAIDDNGIITWTPGQAQAPSTNTITTLVSDNGSPPLYASNSFSVIVNDLNSAPVLPVQADQTIAGLSTLVVTNTATNSDIHAVSLTYALTTSPTNATIDTSGVITWTPVAAQVPSTNLITTVATDYDPLAVNAQQMSTTNSFTVTVLLLPAPVFQSITVQTGAVTLTWSAVAGYAYNVEYKTNLPDQDWTMLAPGVVAAGTNASVTDVITGVQQRFYRVSLVP